MYPGAPSVAARARVPSSFSDAEPGGLEASLLELFHDHQNSSVRLRELTGDSQFANISFPKKFSIFRNFWFFMKLMVYELNLYREVEKGGDQEGIEGFGSFGRRCEQWGPGMLHQREANRARSSGFSGFNCPIHEADRSMAHCHSYY